MGLNVATRVNPRPLPAYKPINTPPPSPVASLAASPRKGGGGGAIRRSESAILTTSTSLKLSTRSSRNLPLRRTVSANCSYYGEGGGGGGTSSSSNHFPNNEEFTWQSSEPTTLFDTFIPSPPPRPPTASTSSSFRHSKLELLEPSELGISPDPPDWPARDELIRHEIARRANCVDIPISVRMMMKKRQQQRQELQQLEEVGKSGSGKLGIANAVASTVTVIREMQNHALGLRGLALDDDFESISGTAEVEMNSSFVWLFREVFARTPDLMMDVMMLTVDFASVSIQNHSTVEQIEDKEDEVCEQEEDEICEEEDEEEEEEIQQEIIEIEHSPQKETSFSGENHYPNAVDDDVYYRTDLFYQIGISKEPSNALLLANYAQFLFLVTRDYDRSEQCYKRAIQLDTTDPEAMSGYAKFLWKIRDDLWGAEDMYQRAVAADPENSHHVANYAHFLWATGAEDTCYPLDPVS